jgi:Primase C terminal 1 (PriCT-1)/Bifunctional DNA primase/polymerase, N-terminal
VENQQSFEQPLTAVNVTVSRRQRRPREYLTEREIEKLMDAARGNRWGHRDATAILLAYRDTRGDGGYVLAPPSKHPTGRRYCWSVDSANLFAAAPQWLLDKITAPAAASAIPAADWRALVQGTTNEGARDCTATKLAGYLLRRFIDPIVALELLQAWNATRCAPPLPPADIERIVASIADKEQRRRQAGRG